MVKSNVTTITLTGAEQEVEFDKPYSYFWCANMGSSDVLMSVNSVISDGADGVVIVPAGGSACTMHGYTANKVYLSGSGKLQVMGTYSAHNPFKTAAKGGGEIPSADIVVQDGTKEVGGITAEDYNEFKAAATTAEEAKAAAETNAEDITDLDTRVRALEADTIDENFIIGLFAEETTGA